jgi:hypothetical protein
LLKPEQLLRQWPDTTGHVGIVVEPDSGCPNYIDASAADVAPYWWTGQQKQSFIAATITLTDYGFRQLGFDFTNPQDYQGLERDSNVRRFACYCGEIEMKRKGISALVYAVTAFILAGFFEGLYGGEPIIYHVRLIHAATAGAVLFVAAFALCLFTLRFGIVCGLLAGILSWPYFAVQMFGLPWHDLMWFARYRTDTLAAIAALILSSIYSVYTLRVLRRLSS